jgi:hypothetical protein
MYSRLSHFKYLAVFLFALLVGAGLANADSDPRMVVEISADEQGKIPAVQDAIQLALPVLWDRIILQSSRSSLSDSMKAMPFLLRVVPHTNGMQVTFNPERVWQYLDQHQIAYLKVAPHLNFEFGMVNRSGDSMPKTVDALRQHAQSVASKWGIQLDPASPLIVANWHWLDASQLYLNVQSDTALAQLSETRKMNAGDPLAQLQAWVEELLLKAREGTVETSAPETPIDMVQQADGVYSMILTISQQATLPAQVVMEDALRQDAHVKAVIPRFLSSDTRQYRILLTGMDDSWVEAWFRHRGMQATPSPDGWLVQ